MMGNEHAHVSLPCLKQKEEEENRSVDLCFSLIMRGKEFRLEGKTGKNLPSSDKTSKKIRDRRKKNPGKSEQKKGFFTFICGKIGVQACISLL